MDDIHSLIQDSQVRLVSFPYRKGDHCPVRHIYPPCIQMHLRSMARSRILLVVALLASSLSLFLLGGLFDSGHEANLPSSIRDFYWIDVS